jgi:uncharacterized protein YhfF
MKDIHESVLDMWRSYLKSLGETIESTEKTFTSWHFEITKEGANNLVNLVSTGKKQATAASLWVEKHDHGVIPKTGDLSIITDWEGNAKCIIQTTKIDIVPYDEVTAEFAAIEGEGDQSLDYWRKVHLEYYTKECKRIGKVFTPKMPVICESFEVVYK